MKKTPKNNLRVRSSPICRTTNVWKSSSFGTVGANRLTRLEVEVAKLVNKSTLAKRGSNWCLGLSTSHHRAFDNAMQCRDLEYFKFSKLPLNLKQFQYNSTWSPHVSAIKCVPSYRQDYSPTCFRNNTFQQKKRDSNPNKWPQVFKRVTWHEVNGSMMNFRLS